MRVLLDTNTLLFAADDSPRLSASARAVIANPANDLWVSAVSLAEVAIKMAIGKLALPASAPASLVDLPTHLGCFNLPFLPEHAERMRTLPLLHRDPFDRMIIAQALVEDLDVMTTDRRFAAYGVRLVEPYEGGPHAPSTRDDTDPGL